MQHGVCQIINLKKQSTWGHKRKKSQSQFLQLSVASYARYLLKSGSEDEEHLSQPWPYSMKWSSVVLIHTDSNDEIMKY